MRIYHSLGGRQWTITQAIMDTIESYLQGLVEESTAGVFSGGSFGGGGATREIPAGTDQQRPRIMVIIEEI